ncbi:MAG TPA: hypothetical protein VFU22_31220 [Roseiflexaceae bacterium]|nr:hypothetical protein [Roseiflexaceae bacterium]
MSPAYLEYQLQNGYIHNWLVAGPQAIAVLNLERFGEQDLQADGGRGLRLPIARHYYQRDSGIAETPAERAKLAVGQTTMTWAYASCGDDHFVDLTAFHHTTHYLRAWAYAQLVCPAAQSATCILTTNGPADVWLNGQHIHRQEHFAHQIPQSVAFQAALRAGRNEVLVRFEEVAIRECPYAIALQIVGIGDEASVQLPTTIENVARRQLLERVFAAAYLERAVYEKYDQIAVRWPDDLRESATATLRLQRPTGQIYTEGQILAQAGAAKPMGKAYEYQDGAHQIVLMPPPEEYYEHGMRVSRAIGLQILKNSYSETPYGTYAQRRHETLADAAERAGLFAQIARMELGQWPRIDLAVIQQTIDGINARADCSDFVMVGVLGVLHRYLDDPAFPQELKQPLEQCVLDFKYWMDEPGSDAMCYWSENHQILFHTCAVLAGQLYPERVFSNTGQLGRWHREKGERMALDWLRKRASGGYREWDSNCYFEHDVLALAHLADLAENQQIGEFAAIVMDKLFFTMAVNSFRGVFGSTHGRTYTPMIRGGRLETTAGIGRLLWGMGVFNHHILGSVSLACAESYELPPIIAQIAADQPEALWSRERHAGVLEQWCDLMSGAWEINKVTYKTPDFMLCSAQDYHPGDAGYQQHIWQATLGPDAVVFVTHPPCVNEENSHRPNFWHGNTVLPRVAQWQDVLIAVHKLPEDDWMGFTHAYFPIGAFDEHTLRGGWAFARKGQGYLALAASQGLALITHGDSAYRELRSRGQQNVWLCHIGRAARDGSFEEFQGKVLALDVRFDELSASCTTLSGETLAFGWHGPLLVNGRQEPISGFKHYDNPYCSAEPDDQHMEIRHGDEALRLDFSI